jgi:hypothetical protein
MLTNQNPIRSFRHASEWTIEHFSNRGIGPHLAIAERAMREAGFALYELTILRDSRDEAMPYRFAHGSVVEPDRFQHMTDAARAAMSWYEANRQPIATI